MGVSTFVQPDFTSQSATVYKTSIDDGFAVHNQIGGAFAPHERPSPDLRVSLDAANFSDLVTRTTITKASQITAILTAPSVDPRKDIVFVDRITGNVGVETGAEAASPVDPTIPVGKLPVARINWTTSTTEITNADLDDIRAIGSLGLSTAAFINVGTTDGLIPTLNADGGITLESTAGGATSGPIFDLYRNSSSPADDDKIGAVEFAGRNSVPEKHIYGRILALILNFVDGAEDSELRFLTDIAGTLASRMKLAAGLQLGSPTDGDKGPGTINVENGVFVDGVSIIPAFTQFFESSGQTITSAGLVTLAHSMGVEPEGMLFTLQCTTADLGYSIGDRVVVDMVTNSSAGTGRANGVYKDSTNIYIRFASGSGTFHIGNKTTGANAFVNDSSWDLYVTAWAS